MAALFAVAAPKLLNNLPLHIRSDPTLGFFKSRLEMHFLSVAFASEVLFFMVLCHCFMM